MKAIIQGKNFNKLIDATKLFVSKNINDHFRTWIRIEFLKDKQGVKAIAIDGYKLSIENSYCDYVEDDFIIYVKPNIRKFHPKENLFIELDGKRAYIQENDDVIGFTQPTDASYFDYAKLLQDIKEQEVLFKISFNSQFLIDALRSAKVGSSDLNNMVTLEFRGNEKPVFIRTEDDNIKMILPIRTRK